MPPVQDQDQAPFTRTYVAAAGADNVIKATPGLLGTYLIDAEFTVGITADITTQTNVAFVWR
jgi:hypothetical protein